MEARSACIPEEHSEVCEHQFVVCSFLFISCSCVMVFRLIEWNCFGTGDFFLIIGGTCLFEWFWNHCSGVTRFLLVLRIFECFLFIPGFVLLFGTFWKFESVVVWNFLVRRNFI